MGLAKWWAMPTLLVIAVKVEGASHPPLILQKNTVSLEELLSRIGIFVSNWQHRGKLLNNY
jgi:hypothetical protein